MSDSPAALIADTERLRREVSAAVQGAVSDWTASETLTSRIRAVEVAVGRIMALIDGSVA